MWDRRTLMAGLVGAAAASAGRPVAQAAVSSSRLEFAIWRNGQKIGSHAVRLQRDADGASAEIEAELTVRVGPVPVFRHRHTASETWSGGRLQRLDARTLSNGIATVVAARAEPGGLVISRGGRTGATLPVDAAGLTHWNQDAMQRPLFNPETGAPLNERVTRTPGDRAPAGDGARTIPATVYALVGETRLFDWYDAEGVWCALRTRAPDGSWVEYRRL